jgi:hypothetical protein
MNVDLIDRPTAKRQLTHEAINRLSSMPVGLWSI